MSIELYEQCYENIIHSDLTDRQNDLKLAELMTDMESTFSIPMIKDESWNEGHEAVVELFNRISNSRKL
jgi:hypothetical protein